MKSLTFTLNKIIKVVPELGLPLAPVKKKLLKGVQEEDCWKEAIVILNAYLQDHPKKEAVKAILTYKKKQPPTKYIYKDVDPGDVVLGMLPDHIADRARKHSNALVQIEKKRVELDMTRDDSKYPAFSREVFVRELKGRQLLFDVNDYFNVWDKQTMHNFTIKVDKNNNLVMTATRNQPCPSCQQQQQGNRRIISTPPIPMDGDTLKNFFKMLGLQPPDLGEDEDEEEN